MRYLLATAAAAIAMLSPPAATAHHTYAMYDGSRTLKVEGTVAKVEWRNPHIFLWLYVPNAKAPSGFDLYAFENGSVPVMQRLGWQRETLRAGDAVGIEYWPLKDGRQGGHLHKVTLRSGEVLEGAGGPARPGQRP